MKVFISWSGEHSNKIAEILKKWIKHVIQSVEPFVSSQDISKGARWSTDIAKELHDTNFGILCVTKDNFEQPWLLFEAGALSKSLDKSYVVPLLFNLEPSDLQDSPLLQFQATSFSEDEIKKLMVTLNTACGSSALEAHELEEAFSVWYPKLVVNLEKIGSGLDKGEISEKTTDDEKTVQILEEILGLTRINQKLLRNPDTKTTDVIESINEKLDTLNRRTEKTTIAYRRMQRFRPMMFEDLMRFGKKEINGRYAFQMALSIYRDSYPWIYDMGKELLDVLKSKKPMELKKAAVDDFREMLAFTEHLSMEYEHPEMTNENRHFLREMPMIIMRCFDELVYEGPK